MYNNEGIGYGTSFSAAVTTGLALIARQYFTDGFYPTGRKNRADQWIGNREPSGALIKAILINSACNLLHMKNLHSREKSFENTEKSSNRNTPIEEQKTKEHFFLQGYGVIKLTNSLFVDESLNKQYKKKNTRNPVAQADEDYKHNKQTGGGQEEEETEEKEEATMRLYVDDSKIGIKNGQLCMYTFDMREHLNTYNDDNARTRKDEDTNSNSSNGGGASEEGNKYKYYNGGGRLSVTLSWYDYPSFPYASSTLVNNLDLEVYVQTSPSSSGRKENSSSYGNNDSTDRIYDSTPGDDSNENNNNEYNNNYNRPHIYLGNHEVLKEGERDTTNTNEKVNTYNLPPNVLAIHIYVRGSSIPMSLHNIHYADNEKFEKNSDGVDSDHYRNTLEDETEKNASFSLYEGDEEEGEDAGHDDESSRDSKPSSSSSSSSSFSSSFFSSPPLQSQDENNNYQPYALVVWGPFKLKSIRNVKAACTEEEIAPWELLRRKTLEKLRIAQHEVRKACATRHASFSGSPNNVHNDNNYFNSNYYYTSFSSTASPFSSPSSSVSSVAPPSMPLTAAFDPWNCSKKCKRKVKHLVEILKKSEALQSINTQDLQKIDKIKNELFSKMLSACLFSLEIDLFGEPVATILADETNRGGNDGQNHATLKQQNDIKKESKINGYTEEKRKQVFEKKQQNGNATTKRKRTINLHNDNSYLYYISNTLPENIDFYLFKDEKKEREVNMLWSENEMYIQSTFVQNSISTCRLKFAFYAYDFIASCVDLHNIPFFRNRGSSQTSDSNNNDNILSSIFADEDNNEDLAANAKHDFSFIRFFPPSFIHMNLLPVCSATCVSFICKLAQQNEGRTRGGGGGIENKCFDVEAFYSILDNKHLSLKYLIKNALKKCDIVCFKDPIKKKDLRPLFYSLVTDHSPSENINSNLDDNTYLLYDYFFDVLGTAGAGEGPAEKDKTEGRRETNNLKMISNELVITSYGYISNKRKDGYMHIKNEEEKRNILLHFIKAHKENIIKNTEKEEKKETTSSSFSSSSPSSEFSVSLSEEEKVIWYIWLTVTLCILTALLGSVYFLLRKQRKLKSKLENIQRLNLQPPRAEDPKIS